MTFDPMTGEPIEDKQEDGLKFDPMTGEPIRQQPAPEPVQEASGFDPMTGKPLGQQQTPPPAQNMGGFDPMTGKPLGQQTPPPAQNMGGFDPMTGKPVENSGKKKSRLPLLIGIAAAVVVVAVLAVAAITSGLFLGKSGKVMLAAANTVKDVPHFVEALEPLGILEQDKYTVSFSCDVDDVKISGEARVSGKEKQISAVLDYDGYPKVELLGGIDAQAVRFQVPAVSKYVFTYNYKGKNTGYLVDEMDDEIDTLNAMLEYMAKGNSEVKTAQKELIKVFTDELKRVKFTNAEKEEYTIDDKDVTCKGYRAVITGSNMVRIADGLEDVMNAHFAALFGNDMLDTDDLAEAFDDLRDEAEDMEDIELTFYIYKNKLAAVRVSSEDEEVELCFEGGDYRIQNMTLKMDGYRIQLSGKDTGSKETFTLKARYGRESEEIGSLEYNYENGKFLVDLDGTSISGKLTKSGSGLTLKISEVTEYYYSYSPNLEFTVQKGAKMEKYSGKEFDLGNADEDELADLAEDIEDKLLDSDLYDLFDDLYYLF